MAGKRIHKIYCWKIEADGLSVYMASSESGAVRVGASLKKTADCVDYFKDEFPGIRLIRDEKMNQPLMEALLASLKGSKAPRGLKMDIRLTPFQQMVLEAVRKIPFGRIRTYGEVAASVGSLGGARAVGQVMNRNPLPIIFP